MVSSSESPEHTFLFADISGFTALTEAHGDEEAADLAGQFFADVRVLLGEHGAEEVKTLGDAVMIRCDSAAHSRFDSFRRWARGMAFRASVLASTPAPPSSEAGIGSGPRSTWRRGCPLPPPEAMSS